jgi:hypothetical protein
LLLSDAIASIQHGGWAMRRILLFAANLEPYNNWMTKVRHPRPAGSLVFPSGLPAAQHSMSHTYIVLD